MSDDIREEYQHRNVSSNPDNRTHEASQLGMAHNDQKDSRIEEGGLNHGSKPEITPQDTIQNMPRRLVYRRDGGKSLTSLF